MLRILTVMCDRVTGLPTLAGDHRVQAPSVDPELDTWLALGCCTHNRLYRPRHHHQPTAHFYCICISFSFVAFGVFR